MASPQHRRTSTVQAILSGAFEGGLAVVLAQPESLHELHPRATEAERPAGLDHRPLQPAILTPENSADCLLQEEERRDVHSSIPHAMQITQLEFTTPHHVIIPGEPLRSADHRRIGSSRSIMRQCSAGWADFLDACHDHRRLSPAGAERSTRLSGRSRPPIGTSTSLKSRPGSFLPARAVRCLTAWAQRESLARARVRRSGGGLSCESLTAARYPPM